MSNQKPHEVIQDNIDNLRYAKTILSDLRRGSQLLGLTLMENQLDEVMAIINHACRQIHEASNDSLNESYQQARQATGNLLSGVLAGIDIGQKSNDSQEQGN